MGGGGGEGGRLINEPHGQLSKLLLAGVALIVPAFPSSKNMRSHSQFVLYMYNIYKLNVMLLVLNTSKISCRFWLSD